MDRLRAGVAWTAALAVDVWHEYRADKVGDLAASITFWTILSIPAAVLALISALGPFEAIVGTDLSDDLQQTIVDFVAETFSDSGPLEEAVTDLFEADQSRVLTLTTAIAIFTLSRGFAGIIRGLDDVYEVIDRRSWWHVRLVAIGFGIGTILVVAGTSTALALLPGRIGALSTVILVVGVLVGVVGWATALFHFGPYHETPWRYDLPGGIVTAVGWTVVTQLFAVYVRLTDNSNQVQSTVGALLLAITLLYVFSLVMLIGAEVNDVLTRRAGVAQAPTAIKDRFEAALDRVDEIRDDVRDRFDR